MFNIHKFVSFCVWFILGLVHFCFDIKNEQVLQILVLVEFLIFAFSHPFPLPPEWIVRGISF